MPESMPTRSFGASGVEGAGSSVADGGSAGAGGSGTAATTSVPAAAGGWGLGIGGLRLGTGGKSTGVGAITADCVGADGAGLTAEAQPSRPPNRTARISGRAAPPK
jgi:hypothetical protein